MRIYEYPNDIINTLMNDTLDKYKNSIPRKAFIEAMQEAARISFLAKEEENNFMRNLFLDAKEAIK